MLRLLRYLKKKECFLAIVSIALILVEVYFELRMPDYTKNLTSIVQSGTVDIGAVISNGLKMLLMAFLSMLCSIAVALILNRVSNTFSAVLRKEVFYKVVDLSNREINGFSTSSLITRTTSDVRQVEMFMSMGFQMLIKSPIMAVLAIMKISSADVNWTKAMAVCIGIMLVFVGIVVAICLPKFNIIQKLSDDLNRVTSENISGVRVIRAFNAEKYQENKFEEVNLKMKKTNLFTSRITGLLAGILSIGLNVLTLVIYFIGASLINSIAMTDAAALQARVDVIANMTVFTSYCMQVIMSFVSLLSMFIILPRTIICARRINEVLDSRNALADGERTDSAAKGEVEFRNVSFGYNDNHYVLKNLNFRINHGETVAIIGATGSGKTSLINLISRFYDADQGQVLVDGIDVKEYQKDALDDRISYAFQNAVLFKDSIKNNITYGSREYDEEKMLKAMEIAQCDFVKTLPEGYESQVAQGGTNFSGGQKQRLTVARAVYKDAEIIIFDDSFSALDYKTDLALRKAIKENLKDTTVIIVAQRIGTIKNADRIIVLDQGEIVGTGTHEQLLKDCSVYREIALSQLREEEL